MEGDKTRKEAKKEVLPPPPTGWDTDEDEPPKVVRSLS
jgi:hypothetical protein